MIFHENHLLFIYFLSNIRKDVARFVVCCSRDWRFKIEADERMVGKSLKL